MIALIPGTGTRKWSARTGYTALSVLPAHMRRPAPAPAPAAEQPPAAPRIVGAREAARLLGVSLATVHRRCRNGQLAAEKDDEGAWIITLPAA